jgi:dienelactone hydrolase
VFGSRPAALGRLAPAGPGRRAVTVHVRRAVAAVVVALAGPGLVGCSSGDGAATGDGGPAGTVAEPDHGPFAVGQRDLTLVDTTRGTPAASDDLPARPDRTIEVRVVYPSDGDAGPEPDLVPVPGGTATADAEPLDGGFPLVVIAHGYAGRAESFQGWAERLARRGHVVALPTFPLSNRDVGVAEDVRNQPGDVSFVIDELGDPAPEDPLAGHVDVGRVAVAGHSLGAATALGVAYNSCCVDDRVDAAVLVAGGPLPYEGGTYEDMPPTPMLVAHGEADTTVPVAASDAVVDLASGPVWYLRTRDADHTSVLVGPDGELLAQAVTALLDAAFGGDADALDGMGAVVEDSGRGEWRTANAAQAGSSGCPDWPVCEPDG